MRLQLILVAAWLLVTGFGDGIGYGMAELTGQKSPWIFLLPLVAGPVVVYLAVQRPLALARMDLGRFVMFAAFLALLFVVESLVIRDFYLIGLLQLLAFLLTFLLIRSVFSSAPAWLDIASRRALPPIHYFLCAYLVLEYVVVHVLCVDIGIRHVLTGGGAQGSDYYGLRPSGFSREPSWAAIAVAASYIGVHYLVPSRRLWALLALLAATGAIASATGFVFVAAVLADYVVRSLRKSSIHPLIIRPSRAPMRAALAGLADHRPAAIVSGVLVLAIALALSLIARTPANVCPHPPPPVSIAEVPTASPIPVPTATPGEVPTASPIPVPTATPGEVPTASPIPVPTATPGEVPTASPIPVPTATPGEVPTASPIPVPTATPGEVPTASPIPVPTATPGEVPTASLPPITSSAQQPLTRVASILSGQDPSSTMRLISAEVGWHVIEESFPLGVGYGNYRRHAIYPSGFQVFADLSSDSAYKSDSLVLNYVAELGVLGALMVMWTLGLLLTTRRYLLFTFAALVGLGSGTFLLPPVLAMATIVGLLIREERSKNRARQAPV